MPAPDEPQALDALRRVQALGPADFERALESEIGEPVVAVLHALARALHPQDDDDAVAKRIHLMVLAWLMARRAP